MSDSRFFFNLPYVGINNFSSVLTADFNTGITGERSIFITPADAADFYALLPDFLKGINNTNHSFPGIYTGGKTTGTVLITLIAADGSSDILSMNNFADWTGLDATGEIKLYAPPPATFSDLILADREPGFINDSTFNNATYLAGSKVEIRFTAREFNEIQHPNALVFPIPSDTNPTITLPIHISPYWAKDILVSLDPAITAGAGQDYIQIGPGNSLDAYNPFWAIKVFNLWIYNAGATSFDTSSKIFYGANINSPATPYYTSTPTSFSIPPGEARTLTIMVLGGGMSYLVTPNWT